MNPDVEIIYSIPTLLYTQQDASLGGNFNLETVLKSYYTYDNISPAESETKLTGDDLTNFPEILASKTEMAGIQKLIDEHIKVNK